MAVGEHVGGLEQPAGIDEGVEHPGAVVAGVALTLVERLRCGEWDQGGLDERRRPQRAAALDPGAAGLVLGDREVSAVVGGAFVTVEGFLVAAFLTVGVDHRDQVEGDPLELGGVQGLGVGKQHLHAASA